MKKIKNLTAAEILKQIKLTVICGEEITETNACDGFSTWFTQFDASNPYEAFTPESREYFQNKLFVAFAAGMLPAEVTETRTNEVGPDGCWVFTVETAGALNPYEEAEEETEETETEETEAETIEETAEEAKEVVTMKKYFKVTFEYAEGIYCTNLAHAETAEDVEREYSEYPWRSVKEAQPWDVEEAKMKGMPIIEVEAAAPSAPSAPSANEETAAEEQTTETTNTTDTEEEEEEQNMKQYSIKPEYYDLWGAWEGNDTVTEEQIRELSKEWEKPIDELMEQVEEIKEEETTMKNTKHMTKAEAIREIATLSSSTLARICGSTNYSIIDDCCNKLILAASSMADDAFCDCENWIDVLHTINASDDNDIDNPYLLGNMDYQEYMTKYGHAEAVTILRNYIETITIEGIQDTKWEQDYIRGAKDMLAIA